jgi:hypothetical protein
MSYSILSPYEDPPFNSGAVRPFECLSNGWQLIKDQYFLYVGMCLVIVVLVTCIPFAGIIYGAWMCGIYYALLGRMRGEPASFNAIGKGFSFFSQGFVVALLSGLPFALISVAAKLMELRFDAIERTYPGETPVPPEVLTEQLTWLALVIGGFALLHLITGLIFPFAYQLVVERHLSGWQAIKLSARAARANLGGVFGLVVLEIILGSFGIVLCCVGLVFVMPITKAAWTVAYRQVFPAPPQEQPMPPPFQYPPPPPPVFGTQGSA